MSGIKREPTDPEDMEFCYGYKINDQLKEDFNNFAEEARHDFLMIQLYIKQSEMIQLAKIVAVVKNSKYNTLKFLLRLGNCIIRPT